jgi:ribose/xylose/arabinose/galactoside ABC-type transport system permease subunit
VALGGTSIFGGVGSVWRTVLGVLILGMLTNGFDLLAAQCHKSRRRLSAGSLGWWNGHHAELD